MNSFKTYILREAYKKISKQGDKLAKIEPLIDWNKFRPIIQPMYHNKTKHAGARGLWEERDQSTLQNRVQGCQAKGKL